MASLLITLALCCNCLAAEPMEASFCDVWPLAVGNAWELCFGYDACVHMEITAHEYVHGLSIWTLLIKRYGWTTTYSTYYAVFINGWLFETPDEADLARLPVIGGQMRRSFPDTFRDNETFTVQTFLGTATDPPIVFTSLVKSERVELCSSLGVGEGQPDYCWLFLNRGTGLELPFGVDAGPPTITGTCFGVYEPQVLVFPSQWVEFGQAVRLAVPAASGSNFQWYKDGEIIEDASASTYTKDPVALEDSGSYTCRIWEGPTLFHDTKAVFVSVFPEGSLPVAGTATLIALVVALAAGIHRSRSQWKQRYEGDECRGIVPERGN